MPVIPMSELRQRGLCVGAVRDVGVWERSGGPEGASLNSRPKPGHRKMGL